MLLYLTVAGCVFLSKELSQEVYLQHAKGLYMDSIMGNVGIL